ncbi:golgin subfamily A member 6-like protein 25 [Phlebotomus argentipes]|uniref:golgin subfamily A member 6-like protein 25 n=1 Tax=Phlebotomus argentipes TaxID=94469 RepID=UPI002892FFF0|nr:golgin subfamily A member 6-like protein 25 [Phlebotomus argentipes]
MDPSQMTQQLRDIFPDLDAELAEVRAEAARVTAEKEKKYKVFLEQAALNTKLMLTIREIEKRQKIYESYVTNICELHSKVQSEVQLTKRCNDAKMAELRDRERKMAKATACEIRIKTADQALKMNFADVKQLEERVERVKERLVKKYAFYAAGVAKIPELERELTSLREEAMNMRNVYQSKDQESRELRDKIAAKIAEIDELQTKMENEEEKVDQLKQEMKESSDAISSEKKRIDDFYACQQAHCSKYVEGIDEFKQKKIKNDELQKLLDEKEQMYLDTKAELCEKNERLNDLLAEKEKNVQKLQEERDNIVQRCDELKQTLKDQDKLDKHIEELKEQVRARQENQNDSFLPQSPNSDDSFNSSDTVMNWMRSIGSPESILKTTFNSGSPITPLRRMSTETVATVEEEEGNTSVCEVSSSYQNDEAI